MKDIYLKFTKKTNSKDIPGESTDAEHQGWIEVGRWSQEIAQPISTTSSTSGGHTSERCKHGEMGFTKDIDKASVYIWEACSAAYSYDVEVRFFRASGTVRTKYLTIKLTDAIISHSSVSIPDYGLPVEVIGIKYSKVTWEHKSSKSDGTANIGNDYTGWDLSKNKVAA